MQQQVAIFASVNMASLEEAINKWLQSGQVELKGLSYSADHRNQFFSAMLYYVPSHANLLKQWREK